MLCKHCVAGAGGQFDAQGYLKCQYTMTYRYMNPVLTVCRMYIIN